MILTVKCPSEKDRGHPFPREASDDEEEATGSTGHGAGSHNTVSDLMRNE